MISPALRSLTIASLLVPALASALLAQNDPFIGKWKLSVAKSKLSGQTVEIQEVAPDTFVFKEDEHSDTIFADGLDHPRHFGDTMSISNKGPGTWAINYRGGGVISMDTLWKVSADEKTLTYTAAGTRPNGQRFNNKMILKRTGGTAGLAGTWESVDVELSSPREIFITANAGDGHVITFPGTRQVVRMKYDGKQYREDGPTVAADATSSGRRMNPRTIETTERIGGKVMEVATATISEDGKTQTIVVVEPDDKTPVTLVYEREQ